MGTKYVCPSVNKKRRGFEPHAHLDASSELKDTCELCQVFGAANALRSGGIQCLQSAFADAKLQEVILAWSELSHEARSAIVELVAFHK